MMLLALIGCFARLPVDTSPTDTTTPGSPSADARLQSAFFGLDNTLPDAIERACPDGGGQDGMPIIFSEEVAPDTLQAGDITVITASGARRSVGCVTLAPAVDPAELRTALLVGELGGGDDPPVQVEVSGHVISQDGVTDFHGETVAVTPLAEGPFLVSAELASPDAFLGSKPRRGPFGTRCPDGTAQAVRVTWAGGITKPGGAPADMAEGALYAVTLQDGTVVPPDALADLGDGDNNHLLCFRSVLPVASVSFPAGHVTDPNEDRNPQTSVAISPRR